MWLSGDIASVPDLCHASQPVSVFNQVAVTRQRVRKHKISELQD